MEANGIESRANVLVTDLKLGLGLLALKDYESNFVANPIFLLSILPKLLVLPFPIQLLVWPNDFHGQDYQANSLAFLGKTITPMLRADVRRVPVYSRLLRFLEHSRCNLLFLATSRTYVRSPYEYLVPWLIKPRTKTVPLHHFHLAMIFIHFHFVGLFLKIRICFIFTVNQTLQDLF